MGPLQGVKVLEVAGKQLAFVLKVLLNRNHSDAVVAKARWG